MPVLELSASIESLRSALASGVWQSATSDEPNARGRTASGDCPIGLEMPDMRSDGAAGRVPLTSTLKSRA